ncbi:uncharacterized protein N7511_008776 [Penicillium nucicola]|uniref:uncharacterized protein n=1 Tax=Penicillium nucicola TaxID=1850975 RepID=UPI00254555F6|nr:uncharacterized protein N7511_008776 [Penicillium nucicola]KAJ5747080.1 hypothetical protein N7511_008776 [Penicillium nucicola]
MANSSPSTSSSVESTANLNILCQTLPPPGRFPIRDLPLSTTIGQLRTRIAETFPGNPPSSTQRLIYQGRALLGDSVTLGDILPAANPILQNTSYAFHLVLPPPEPTPAPASNVSGSLRPREARSLGPGAPSLFGSPAPNTPTFGQNTPASSGIFGPSTAPTTGLGQAVAGSGLFGNPPTQAATLTSNRPAGSGLFGSAPANANPFGQANPGPGFAVNNGNPTAQAAAAAPNHPAGSGLFGPVPANTTPFGHGNLGFGAALNNGHPFANNRNFFNSAGNNTNGGFPGFQTRSPEQDTDTRLRLARLQGQIEEIERQLERNLLPHTMQQIINTRTELLGLQDDQFSRRNSLPEVERLITRILSAYSRARQLESMQPPVEEPIYSPLPNWGNSIYLAVSPNNSPALIMGTQIHNHPTNPLSSTAELDPPIPPQPLHPAAMAENVARQAIPNRQRNVINAEQVGLVQHLGRIWLFARLWFICYLTSEPGTWRRYIMVAFSLLATFLSGTEAPGQILRAVVTPALHHLEALVRAGGPADPAAANDAEAEVFSLRDQLRRLERSVVLLVASIVPGFGERQVEAHNAAEAEAERARQQQVQAEQERQAQNAEAAASAIPAVEEVQEEAHAPN